MATGSAYERGRHWVCGLTFELTPTAKAGCARREVEHKQAHFAAGTACRSGSGAERGVRPQSVRPWTALHSETERTRERLADWSASLADAGKVTRKVGMLPGTRLAATQTALLASSAAHMPLRTSSEKSESFRGAVRTSRTENASSRFDSMRCPERLPSAPRFTRGSGAAGSGAAKTGRAKQLRSNERIDLGI